MSEQYTIDHIKDRYLAMTDEVSRLREENKILRSKLDLLLQAAYSEEYTTSFLRVSAMRDILGTGNE